MNEDAEHEPGADVEDRQQKSELIHKVIPAETLEEIAIRYDVSVQDIGRWNGVDENTPLEPGRELTIEGQDGDFAEVDLSGGAFVDAGVIEGYATYESPGLRLRVAEAVDLTVTL